MERNKEKERHKNQLSKTEQASERWSDNEVRREWGEGEEISTERRQECRKERGKVMQVTVAEIFLI